MKEKFFQLAQQLKIGNTPLKLIYVNEQNNTKVFAKEEYYNPTGSIKDRTALGMIADALANGKLKKGDTVVEATSGNTGIALAYICGKLGIKVILTMPDSMSIERRQLLQSYGAELVLTDGKLGMSGAVERAKELAQAGAVEVRQFDNYSNILSHYYSTAEEILEQCPSVDIFVAGVGTGGTLCGTAKRIKEVKPSVKAIALEPSESAVLSGKEKGAHGIQGIGAGFVPIIVDRTLIDDVITVDTAQAKEMAVKLNKEFQCKCGISSGCNVSIAIKLADDVNYRDKTIVTVLPDSVNRYMSVLDLD